MTTKLPHNISLYGAGYAVRVTRNRIQWRSGPHAALDDALAARDKLLAELGPPSPTRRRANQWPAMFAAQVAARPGVDMTGIHIKPGGLSVSIRRDGVLHDGGYYSGEDALARAVEARDGLVGRLVG